MSAFPQSDAHDDHKTHFGDGALRRRTLPPPSAEEVQQLQQRLDMLRKGVEAPYQMPFEYAEVARDIADFAPKAFDRYKGHGVSFDYWIMSHIYEVDSQAMAAMSQAASLNNKPSIVQEAAMATWRALAHPLEKMHAEEAIWIVRHHIDEHDLPEDSPICRITWRGLEAAVEDADWDTDAARRISKATTKLRKEVALDHAGRPFDPDRWATILWEVEAELQPESEP